MTYEQAFLLLKIVEAARDLPKLKALHDKAMADLEAIDASKIGFDGHVEEEE
jgi:hypothetical protein